MTVATRTATIMCGGTLRIERVCERRIYFLLASDLMKSEVIRMTSTLPSGKQTLGEIWLAARLSLIPWPDLHIDGVVSGRTRG